MPSASEEYEDDKGDYSNTFSVHRTDDSIISGTGWSSFYRDHVIGNASWNSLGDGYYTHQETEELAELVSRERLEQDNIERSTEHVRRWIQGPELGRGTFGIVSEAIDATTGEILAVKQVLASELRPKAVEVLQREMTVLRKLRHSNIVSYRGMEYEENKLSLFMELCPGGSISTVLASFGCLSTNIVRRYTYQIMAGLGYLHRHSIVHRDIKTGNALLNRDGVVKLADFGGATTLAELGSGSMYGTARYLAPEVLNGGRMGRQLDIWAVGFVVVEMFTNRFPFADQCSNDLTFMRRIRDLKCSPEVPKEVPAEAVPFIQVFYYSVYFIYWYKKLLKHPFLLRVDTESNGLNGSSAASPDDGHANAWRGSPLFSIYALTTMKSNGDPQLIEVKNWIMNNRADVMLLVDVDIVHGSWDWISMVRFFWAKATLVSSQFASKFRPDEDLSVHPYSREAPSPQEMEDTQQEGDPLLGYAEGAGGGSSSSPRSQTPAHSGEGAGVRASGAVASTPSGGRREGALEGGAGLRASGAGAAAARTPSQLEEQEHTHTYRENASKNVGARSKRDREERRDRRAFESSEMERKFARMLPGIDTFSPDLEALYTEWLHKNVRWRLDRGTTLARLIVLTGFLHFSLDLARSGFNVHEMLEKHKMNIIRSVFVSIFACIPFFPDELINGYTQARRFLALSIGLGICGISLFHRMPWWQNFCMAFIVTVLSGVLSFVEGLSLSLLLSLTHVINIVTYFHGSALLNFESAWPFPASGDGHEASFTLLFTDSVIAILVCLVSTGMIWSDHRMSRLMFVVKMGIQASNVGEKTEHQSSTLATTKSSKEHQRSVEKYPKLD